MLEIFQKGDFEIHRVFLNNKRMLFYFSCVDNGNCGGILGVRTNLVCENQATQTCCHESKIKQPNEDPDYDYDTGDTGEESCSSYAVEGYRLVG